MFVSTKTVDGKIALIDLNDISTIIEGDYSTTSILTKGGHNLQIEENFNVFHKIFLDAMDEELHKGLQENPPVDSTEKTE